MKYKVSRIGVAFVVIFLLAVSFLVVMFPFSMGFSWLLVAVLSKPWNGVISAMISLQYGEDAVPAVVPGLLVNAAILYAIGYGIGKFIRRLKDNS